MTGTLALLGRHLPFKEVCPLNGLAWNSVCLTHTHTQCLPHETDPGDLYTEPPPLDRRAFASLTGSNPSELCVLDTFHPVGNNSVSSGIFTVKKLQFQKQLRKIYK